MLTQIGLEVLKKEGLQLGLNIVQWCSRKQKVMALSFTESKYKVVSQLSTKIAWLRLLLGKIQIFLSQFNSGLV